MYARLLELSPRFHDRNRSGDLITRITGDVGHVQDALVAWFVTVLPEALTLVEQEVNRRIRENQEVATREMGTEEAIASGATALFGEKYGDKVRVVQVGEFSMELCGGTHARAAGDIGIFKILQETGIAAGVRRIEAVTGPRAVEVFQGQNRLLDQLAALLKSDRGHLEARLHKLLDHQKELEREIASLQGRLNAGQAGELLAKVREVGGTKLLAARLDGLESLGVLGVRVPDGRDHAQLGQHLVAHLADDLRARLPGVEPLSRPHVSERSHRALRRGS